MNTNRNSEHRASTHLALSTKVIILFRQLLQKPQHSYNFREPLIQRRKAGSLFFDSVLTLNYAGFIKTGMNLDSLVKVSGVLVLSKIMGVSLLVLDKFSVSFTVKKTTEAL
jgi:hypothetical protein